MKKILLTILLAALTLFNGTTQFVFANTSNGNEILTELEDIDLSLYSDKTTIITFSEIGFGTQDYKLILYVYNVDKTELSKNYSSNVLNIATAYNTNNKPTAYSNMKLKYISSTEDNSIYKFSVVDENDILKQNSAYQNAMFYERRYDVAGIQLLKLGNRLPIDHPINTTYVYSGTANDNTHKLETLETISLEVHPIWYRTKTSNKGKYYQNQLNSVYFSVPNEYLQDGFNLTSVKAEWYEYKTQPIVILENNDVYNDLLPWVGVDIGESDKNCPHHLYAETYSTSNEMSTYVHYEWGYNQHTSSMFINHDYSDYLPRLTYLFNTNGQSYNTFTLSSEKLTDYIYNYDKSHSNGYLSIKNGTISADLFQNNVDKEHVKGYNVAEISVSDTYDLFSYSDTHTWWNTICDYGLLNTLFGKVPANEQSKLDITPIYKVSDNDVVDSTTISEKLYIDNTLVNDFKSFYDAQSDKTTFLFRFSNTDYKSMPLESHKGYVAEETVFLDFDIIHLQFSKGSETIVYPVVSSPSDLIPSVTPPVENNLEWVLYAGVGVGLAVVCIILYNLFKGENA